MSVDPADSRPPEDFEYSANSDANDHPAEQAELSAEVPEADAMEQRTAVRDTEEESLTRIDPSTANEADAVEQARAVGADEDEDAYR
ncbi:hypothetical protein GCM10009654_08880 [Streptomyces hebeiensis]|uniref:DUF5709 domain-containing protein n=1 Tax=Streptomyces hebeiensis TaxID=229486 RepID=A0ABN1UKG7_9ACTN